MSKVYKETGGRIREARERAHLSRDALAELAKISSKFLYEIEMKEQGFSADTLYKISKALNVSSEYILSGYSVETDEIELMNLLSLFGPEKIKEIVVFLKALYKIGLR